MAAESIALGTQVQAGLQALKLAIESEAQVLNLVQQAVETAKQAELSSSSVAATDPSRLLDIIV
jgi:hypothetical protein